MVLALRRAFLPHYEGEERALHLRLVLLILRVWAIVLVVWVVGRVVLYLTVDYLRHPGPVADVLSILYSIVAIGLGYALARRASILLAGYLMATAVLLYPTIEGMLFPAEAFLLT